MMRCMQVVESFRLSVFTMMPEKEEMVRLRRLWVEAVQMAAL